MEVYEWGWAETTRRLHKSRELTLRKVELVILEQGIQRTTQGTRSVGDKAGDK